MPPANVTTDRGTQLVDEALKLVAGGGLGAVTHRSVEAAAGAPHGSVTYWFGSRDGLVAAMVDRLVTWCEGQVGELAGQAAGAFSSGGEPDAEALATGMAAWIDDGRELHLARLELELAAVRDPRLRKRMSEAGQVFWRMCEPIALATGSDDPERDGRGLAAMVDGLLLDRLAHPPQTHALLEAAIRRMLSPRPPSS